MNSSLLIAILNITNSLFILKRNHHHPGYHPKKNFTSFHTSGPVRSSEKRSEAYSNKL